MNEFHFLDALRARYDLNKIGDDCAVLPSAGDRNLLLTADMLVEDVDFRLEWTRPDYLGHKALAVSLSDVAAMGGEAKWALLSIAVPDTLWKAGFLDDFYAGWMSLANTFGVELIGGDLSRTSNGLVIDSIVGGEVKKGRAFLRSTARPGDAIFISGGLGGAAGGLSLLESGTRYSQENLVEPGDLITQQLKPSPELELANTLQSLNIVTAAIDVSDGLSSDLGHLCHSSGVGAVLEASNLPLNPSLTRYFTSSEAFQMALNGGEDFGLLFTVNKRDVSLLNHIGVTQIGEITQDEGKIELISGHETILLEPRGYRHF